MLLSALFHWIAGLGPAGRSRRAFTRPMAVLRGGELLAFHDAVQAARAARAVPDDRHLATVVEWAVDYLQLAADPAARDARKRALLAQRMPGVCAGGLAGLTDPDLSSVYGQILLQIAQALQGRPPMGKPILLAALETDYPHLPTLAATVLRGWPDTAVPEEARQFLD
jgi:hypothetical protein